MLPRIMVGISCYHPLEAMYDTAIFRRCAIMVIEGPIRYFDLLIHITVSQLTKWNKINRGVREHTFDLDGLTSRLRR